MLSKKHYIGSILPPVEVPVQKSRGKFENSANSEVISNLRMALPPGAHGSVGIELRMVLPPGQHVSVGIELDSPAVLHGPGHGKRWFDLLNRIFY